MGSVARSRATVIFGNPLLSNVSKMLHERTPGPIHQFHSYVRYVANI
jgi:hypothetical protein